MQESNYSATIHWSFIKSFLLGVLIVGLFFSILYATIKYAHNLHIFQGIILLYLVFGLLYRQKLRWLLSSTADLYFNNESFKIIKMVRKKNQYLEYKWEDISSYSIYFSGDSISIMLYMKYGLSRELTFKDKNMYASLNDEVSILKLFTSYVNNFNNSHNDKIYFRKGLIGGKVVKTIIYILIITETILIIYTLFTNPHNLIKILISFFLVFSVWGVRYNSENNYKKIISSMLIDEYS